MSIKFWVLATRPKTLSAGVIPVIIGSSIAFYAGQFNWLYFIITFVCSLLIQIITNFINEIYDFKKGADTVDRIGPQRQVASGNISEKSMRLVSIILIIITFILGLILVARGGLPVLLIGVISLILAYGYTGGPYPLAYKGLGDIFVLIFFGLVAVGGTYYIQTLNMDSVVIIAGLAPGFLSMNILGVNNIRDVRTDKNVNKLTLAVRIGARNAKILYIILNVLTYLSIISIYFFTHKVWILLPFLTIFHAFNLSKKILIFHGAELNEILEGTGKLLLIFGLLMSLGFILSKII
jgi:1,4-dihydroxy-2-naphthoate octaprenyltransferase